MIDPNDPDLPDELRKDGGPGASAEDRAERAKELRGLGELIGGKRDEAVKARRESGIEGVWTLCEEAYAGIDEMNRVAGSAQQWRKPTTPVGPLTREVRKDAEQRSTVFIRLTTRYVDMGAAKVKEKALPIDDKPFKMTESVEPDLVESGAASEQPSQNAMPMGAPGQMPAPMGAAAQAMPDGPAPGMPPQQMAPVAEASKQVAGTARQAAEKASNRIWDWLSESNYPLHIRRVIDDAARIGVGVLKGPFPDVRTRKAFSIKDGVGTLEMLRKTAPGCAWVDPWNFFPAGNCGENVHDGDHVLERAFLSESKLEELKKLRGLATEQYPQGEPIYLAEQIDRVIAEGPEKCKQKDGLQRPGEGKKDLYTVWYFHGQLSRKDMITLGAIGADELPDEVVSCHAVITLVNDTVIRAQFNPLEKSGHFPYRVFCWSRRSGNWAGVGVAEQVQVPQNMVNAGTRAWMNNAGVSSGVQLIVDTGKLAPVDGSLIIGGGIKLWATTAEGQGDDVRKFMQAIEIPDRGQSLIAIVQYAFKLAEEMSNIPLISQGQSGPNDPQTFGQAELQNTNANTLLRQVADSLDGNVIEPMIDDFYEYLLLDPDVPLNEKGDFNIIAKGCSAMVEKAIQEQFWMNVLGISVNPAFGVSPARVMDEVVLSKRLDPERIHLTEEEKARMASQPPPEAPQVQAAKIKAQVDIHRQDMADKTKLQISAADIDRDTAYTQSLAQRDEIARQSRFDEHNMRMAEMQLEYALKRNITLDEAKVELTKWAGDLRAQMILAGNDGRGPQVATPAIEPAGRAPEGMAFQA
jgi:hypothetical protein